MGYELKTIARIENGYTAKFGIPRQAGIVDEVESRIVFEPEFRNPDALRGMEDISHLWLIWQFSEAVRDTWSPTVRPPRLGGNTRLGVFATRSPFRPNALGLSCVRLIRTAVEGDGPVLYVAGADLMNGTPIYDIKPYIPYADCHPEASCSFTPDAGKKLPVVMDAELAASLPEGMAETVKGILSRDPRPQYHKDDSRQYSMEFSGRDIKFHVTEDAVIVDSAEALQKKE